MTHPQPITTPGGRDSLRIAFVDVWSSFDPEANFLTDALRRHLSHVQVVSPDESPDVLFHSSFGRQEHLRYPELLHIYFTGENDVPDFNICDYAISFHPISFGHRHLRLPLYCHYVDEFDELMKRPVHYDPAWAERPFCSVVVSNASAGADPTRAAFWEALSQYKPIASGGAYANNVGGRVADKLQFICQYKFNLAMENSRVAHYTTEKIVEAFVARTVPIYWGSPSVIEEFDPSTFINLNDFTTFDEAISYIRRVDTDAELYASYFAASPVARNPYADWEQRLVSFLLKAVAEGPQRVPYGRMGRMYNRARMAAPLVSHPLLARLNILRHGRGAETRL